MLRIFSFAAAMLVAGAAVGQALAPIPSNPSTFSQISCTDVKMHISAGDICGEWRGSQTGYYRYQFIHYLVRGRNGTAEYKATIGYAYDPETYMTVVHSSDLPGYIMSYDGLTQEASSSSDMIKAANSFFRPFTAGSRKCFAFHRRSGVQGSGTRSRTTGWFCDDAKPDAWTAEQMHAVLAAVRFDD